MRGHEPAEVLRVNRDHHARLKEQTTALDARRNEPPFCPRFPEKIGHPDFKKST
jgi:hypothetical protein